MCLIITSFQRQREWLGRWTCLRCRIFIDVNKSYANGKLHVVSPDLEPICIIFVCQDFPAQLVVLIWVKSPSHTTCRGSTVLIWGYQGSTYSDWIRNLESARDIRLSVINTPFVHEGEIGAHDISQPRCCSFTWLKAIQHSRLDKRS